MKQMLRPGSAFVRPAMLFFATIDNMALHKVFRLVSCLPRRWIYPLRGFSWYTASERFQTEWKPKAFVLRICSLWPKRRPRC